MYTERNFKSKKELKEAVELRRRWLAHATKLPGTLGTIADVLRTKEFPNGEPPAVRYFQPNQMSFHQVPTQGTIHLEGPHYPKPHKWYATAQAENNEIIKIIG